LILAEDFEELSRVYLQELNNKKNHSVERKKAALEKA